MFTDKLVYLPLNLRLKGESDNAAPQRFCVGCWFAVGGFVVKYSVRKTDERPISALKGYIVWLIN